MEPMSSRSSLMFLSAKGTAQSYGAAQEVLEFRTYAATRRGTTDERVQSMGGVRRWRP
jgi:hypothetical protein